MKHAIKTSWLQYLVTKRNTYLGLLVISLVINLILGIAVIASIGHERIILVPPTISRSFWVEHNNVSDEYLTEISEFFINLRLNISPISIKQQKDTLLRYIDPSFYDVLKAQLISEEERISKEHVSMAFYPVDIKVDRKHFQTLVTGDLLTTIGSNAIPAKRVSYKISYRYISGRLLVTALEEVKQNG